MRFAIVLLLPVLLAAEPPTSFLDFVKGQAKAMRSGDKPPATLDEWSKQRSELQARLTAAFGGFPDKPCDLDVQKFGELKRDGYTVEKLTIQTMPGVRMTANAYVPHKSGKLPALLMVHGHWKGAKQDPTVQARCIGAAKLGFFVLCVDAFGAGERAIGTALGEYHGEMAGALLLPLGRPLAGIQVYENRRAVDYLLTRPEVDGERIGVTGASGGGNQTMYAAAMDERLKAAVPVCSVGNYQAYLGAACCMCEVVPGALSFTEESGLLAMVAPRALMIVSATRDAPQFSVGAAKVSIAGAMPVFKLFGKEKSFQHAIFESGHDYSKPMREAMYGWMTKHLKGEGDGSPIPEPKFETEKPEDLRCFPGETRPKDFVTLPKFAAREASELLKRDRNRDDRWMSLVKMLRMRTDESGEPQLKMSAFEGKTRTTVILVTFEDPEKIVKGELAQAIRAAGHRLVVLEPRATGSTAVARDVVGRAPDHNSAEWSLWLGRPLLAQWVNDVSRIADREKSEGLVVIGEGPAGLIALAAAATERRVAKAVAINSLASFVSDEPYVGQRLGTIVPGLLRHVGDVGHIIAIAMPKRIVIAGGVNGVGKPLTAAQIREAYKPASGSFTDDCLKIVDKATPAEILKLLDK
ncbi:MAG: acetylxylan esterase [Planctomycetia bacterium]|nr:acetylxylan esterase [Planctomycetia bacterium]